MRGEPFVHFCSPPQRRLLYFFGSLLSALGRGAFCLAQEPVWIQNAILPAASAKERSRYGQQEQPTEAGVASAAPGGLFLIGFRLGLLLLHGLQEDSLVAQADGPLAVPPDLSRSC